MFVKCGNRMLTSGNLLSRHTLQLTSKQSKWSKSLSTTKLSANQYDDLYADRWAKFQCEWFFIRFFYCRGRNCFRLINVCATHSPLCCHLSSLARAFRSALNTREFHTTRTQNKRPNICLTLISSVNTLRT